MRAVVNNAVHVKVKVVELGDTVLGDELRDGGIALREPSEEFGDTWRSLSAVRTYTGMWRSTYPWRLLYFKTVANASSEECEGVDRGIGGAKQGGDGVPTRSPWGEGGRGGS